MRKFTCDKCHIDFVNPSESDTNKSLEADAIAKGDFVEDEAKAVLCDECYDLIKPKIDNMIKIGFPTAGYPGPYDVYVPNMEANPSLLRGFTAGEFVRSGMVGEPTEELLAWGDATDKRIADRGGFIPNNYIEILPEDKSKGT